MQSENATLTVQSKVLGLLVNYYQQQIQERPWIASIASWFSAKSRNPQWVYEHPGHL